MQIVNKEVTFFRPKSVCVSIFPYDRKRRRTMLHLPCNVVFL